MAFTVEIPNQTGTPAISVTGNAATATALQTARTINGTSFDGTGNITVTAAAGTLTGSTLAAGVTASSLTSVGTLTSLTITAGEAALTIGAKTVGALTQVSGLGAGFDVFTPTANCAYYLVVRGQDAATGSPSNAFLDILTLDVVGTWAPQVLSSTTITGGPGARTWSKNASALKVVVGSGTTWYLDLTIIRFPA